MYPKGDDQHTEVKVTSIETSDKHYEVHIDDNGMDYFIILSKDEVENVPDVGPARLYGEGFGKPIRGLFINGNRIYYRTPEEDDIYHNEILYSKTVEEWLERWDEGESVFSVEMGGFGPGYEQSLQIAMTEILRHLIEEKPDLSSMSDDEIKEFGDALWDWGYTNDIISNLGLSGMQYSAARSLATQLYDKGPIAILTDPQYKERHIQISKHFPNPYGDE